MVFRPATPLSVLLLGAFVLLLLSTLSTPIIGSINIATFGGVKFGVFGWCSKRANTCSGVSFGYNMGVLESRDFDCDSDGGSVGISILETSIDL